MPVQPRVSRGPSPHNTSLETSSSSDTNPLRTHLHTLGLTLGLTALADKVERCCTQFRVLACDNGHAYQPTPAERCRLRLCPHSACWRQQRAITRLRRTATWKTAIRGAVAGYEMTYKPGRGWHVHVLAGRQAWVDQAAGTSATPPRQCGGPRLGDRRPRAHTRNGPASAAEADA
jgi:hypothetical protein